MKEWLYRTIFNEEFNYGFGYPRSDTCEQCDLLKVAIDSAQMMNVTNYRWSWRRLHKVTNHYAWIQKIDDDSLVLTFDLQQNLPVPTVTHGAMFYMRQLWVYTLVFMTVLVVVL